MAQIKWIKITTNIFDDEKIQLIEAMPDSDTIIVIWFKLLALAGKSNSNGLVLFSDKVPFTVEMLTTLFRRKQTVVELALRVFEQFDMIQILDNKAILITNWEKHQNTEGLALIREQNRERKQKQREREKLLLDDMSRDSHSDVTLQNKKKNKELEEDKEKEKDIKASNDAMSVETDEPPTKNGKIDFDSICDYWNTHSFLKEITKITDTRKPNVNARIKEHGIEAIYKMIDQAGRSSFLRGDNKQGFMATFDWCFRPKNFVKVLEGNYCDQGKKTYIDEVNARAERLERRIRGEIV